jgi:hypothetical protein
LKQEPSGVLSFINTSSKVSAWLGFAVTQFLLVTYVLYVWTDLKIARLKGWFQRGSVDDFDAKMKKDREERRKLSKSRIEKALRLKAEADAIRASSDEQSKPLWDQSAEVARQLDATPQYGAGSQSRASLEATLKGLREQLNALTATRKQRLAIPEAALEDLADRSTLDDVWTMLHDEAALTAGRQTVRTATVARVVVEVLFPIGYALFAVVASAWRLWPR